MKIINIPKSDVGVCMSIFRLNIIYAILHIETGILLNIHYFTYLLSAIF